LDSSHSITSPQSSSHSSQDSLHRSLQQMQQSQSGGMMMLGPRGAGKKKTGIKSSLGRIFSKKDKMPVRKDLYMTGNRGELTTESELRLAAAQDSTLNHRYV